MRKLAVFFKPFGPKVNIAVGLVGVALFGQRFNNSQNGINILGGGRVHNKQMHVQALGISPKFGNVALGHLGHGNALLVGFFNQFIVNIGKVLHKNYLVATVLQITAQNIKHAKRAGVANVNVVVNRWAAGVNAVLARGLRR